MLQLLFMWQLIVGHIARCRYRCETTDYLVDGNNRRVGKKVGGVLQQGWLCADQLAPVAELDADNRVVARFVYASKSNVPDCMATGGCTYRFITE